MNCLVCLDPSERDYHPACAKALFGTTRIPKIEVKRAALHSFALAMTGKTTLPGVQQKISLGYAGDRGRLQLVAGKGQFILKPQQSAFPEMPQNEHVTMRLADACGIEVPPFGLVRLEDGSLAYLVRRFDRVEGGKKIATEDFCQLGGWFPGHKYDHSTEELVKLVRKYATETLVEVRSFFRRVVFSWWTGNGDMHAKNFSLVAAAGGVHRLSPAYDLVCTRLVIPEDDLALSVLGKKSRLRRDDWLRFGAWCGLPAKAVASVLEAIADNSETALGLIGRSYLPPTMVSAYSELIGERTRALMDR